MIATNAKTSLKRVILTFSNKKVDHLHSGSKANKGTKHPYEEDKKTSEGTKTKKRVEDEASNYKHV